VAINRISGNILRNNLVRGSDLAFQGNLIYIDVVDTRVGINTAATTHTLTVQGDTNISDTLFANNVAATANVSADGITANSISVGNVDIGNLLSGGNLVVNSLASNSFVTAAGNVQAGNLILSDDTITLTVSGNITIAPTGNNLLIIDTVSGMILPQGNTVQRPSPASTGTVRFNDETLRIEFYDGITWQEITTAVTNQTLNGDGSTVNFALDRGTTTAAVLVSLNGVLQLPVTAYAVTGPAGNVLTFTEAPLSTDVIDVRFL
jgi:hypothetical protein